MCFSKCDPGGVQRGLAVTPPPPRQEAHICANVWGGAFLSGAMCYATRCVSAQAHASAGAFPRGRGCAQMEAGWGAAGRPLPIALLFPGAPCGGALEARAPGESPGDLCTGDAGAGGIGGGFATPAPTGSRNQRSPSLERLGELHSAGDLAKPDGGDGRRNDGGGFQQQRPCSNSPPLPLPHTRTGRRGTVFWGAPHASLF